MPCANKILIIAPAWIGDLVMSHSLFQQLKKHQPHCDIDVMAPHWCLPLLGKMPEVSHAMALPFAHGELALLKRWRIGRLLKNKHYDHSFVLPNSWKSALIPFFAGIKRRTGWLGESRYGLLNDYKKINKKIYSLMVQRFVALADNWQILDCPQPKLQADFVQAKQLLQQFGVKTDKPIIALCPGAAYGPAKRWPSHYFAEVAQYFIQQQWQVFLIGSKADQPAAAKIQTGCNQQCVDYTGRLSLDQSVDVLALSQLVLSNDSGLMHIAAALSLPQVAIYGSSTPDFTPPLSEHAQVMSVDLDCRPCFKRQCPLQHLNCLKQVKPVQVIKALEKLCVS